MSYAPGSPEWHAHAEEIRRGERTQPYAWWYLSFATDDDTLPHRGFLGAALVRARGFLLAVELSQALGINPGNCEVRGDCLRDDAPTPPPEMTGRLLSWDEMEKAFGDLVPWPVRGEKQN
jgi:hypothetical protein